MINALDPHLPADFYVDIYSMESPLCAYNSSPLLLAPPILSSPFHLNQLSFNTEKSLAARTHPNMRAPSLYQPGGRGGTQVLNAYPLPKCRAEAEAINAKLLDGQPLLRQKKEGRSTLN